MKATASKTDRLAKSIQAVYQFAAERSQQNSDYLSIEYALEDLAKALDSKRLLVRIIGQDTTQTVALQKLLNLSPLVQEAYQIETSLLPEYIQRRPLPDGLTLKCDRLHDNQSPRYALTSAKLQTIGRNPDKANILLPDELNLVSGCHLELQPVAGDGWQVRDPGSKNGTYLNGSPQKLQGWHRLQIGDQLCLGSASRAIGSATLVFDRPADTGSVSTEVSHLFNCDVLCLITDLSQPLSKAAKQLIAQAGETQIAKLFIIATTPGMGNPEVIQAHWRTMQVWVEEQSYHSWIEQIAMGLQPIAAGPQATVLFPHTRPEFEQFCQTLERLAQEKAEEMLLQRITSRLLQEVGAISSLLNQQEATLMQEIQQAENTLKDLSPSSLKEQIKKPQ
jgi:pSer/pThr/pTyr-binding forkhead associated (FHA) protein